ncbi:MAG: type I-E CRISPR-associated protein Cas7/Cse4/CasC [Candidatus Kapaibacterium sp.]
MKLELHILQNFPPHNLNRDDTGSPKDTEFGGYRRARISSQCLKRSIRMSDEFANELSGRIGKRTKRAVKVIADKLQAEHGKEAEEAKAVASAVISRLIARTDDEGKTNVLFYVGNDELESIATRVEENWEAISPALSAWLAVKSDGEDDEGSKKKSKAEKDAEKNAEKALEDSIADLVKTYLNDHKGYVGSVDIALFGRMLAEQPILNIDAACQVAHAISTNRVSMEFDYFTAVDDLNPDEETGAGMIGTVGYNSSCFYRYAVIDLDQLAENLGGEQDLAKEGARAFIRGAVAAIPSGKQNSFAAHTPPSFVMTVLREKGSSPMSLANAFEQPIRPSEKLSLVDKSISALDTHWKKLAEAYGSNGTHPFAMSVSNATEPLEHLADHRCKNLNHLVDQTMATIDSIWMSGNGVA